MDYTIDTDSEKKTLIVQVNCSLSLEIGKQILLVIASELGRSNLDRVMIDVTKASINPQEPLAGALELATFLRSVGIQSETKFACIYEDAEEHRMYFENVVTLQGLQFKYFRDRHNALAWLQL